MKGSKNGPSDEYSKRVIVNTRIFNTSREQIFNAFSNPEHLALWWGPKNFTNTFYEFDLQPGRIWHFIMHSPDGIDYENKSVFEEIVKPERIVLRHLEPNHEFLLTITLSELNGKTELTWHMLFDSASECNKVREFVVEANEQNLDRLETQLVKMANS
ncbi:SRPBCC family protein [Piscibacillus salipiscarius]|uniref:SRPBCC family protein n=1 Tax=Piscibacillus salipiscarius TaxID=299480 RepID=A0ABW5QD57_9BACI|nr:SRPBCC family protein [Piscibacillus salipiscarius]